MKKTLLSIALMAMLLFATSAYNRDAIGTRVGDSVPALAVANEQAAVDLNQMRGEYVLVTFWSSADAASRVQCNQYASWMKSNQPQGLQHISVNFDKEPQLFQEIARRDKLDTSAQFNVQGEDAARIFSDFGLADGYGSLLISPDGRIDAINPTTSELSSLL